MKKTGLREKFIQYVEAKKLFTSDQPVLLAVSGGIDSVVLSDLFQSCKLKFAIAHCNFQLRGKDSDEDAHFVKQLANSLQVSFFSEVFDTINYKKENKLSLEEAARNLRYAWMEEIRKTFRYHAIATAHHLNDTVETILLHLVKGTGIRGLTGIPVKNQKIIRPLLFATREEIELYARENNLQYRTDVTNLETEFARNKIRNEIIPILKMINPSLEKTFEKNIRHFNDVLTIYNEHVTLKLKKLVVHKGGDQYISLGSLKNLPAAATCLHEWLFPYGFNEDQILQMLCSLDAPGKIFYSATHRLIIDRKNLILTGKQDEDQSVLLIEKENKSVRYSDHRLELDISNYNAGMKFNHSGAIAYFDADHVEYPLMLRKWKPGDYFYPLGLTKKNSKKPGKKKVSDMLTDLKFNLLEKENTWVLMCGEKIIWVVGVRQDERFKLTSSTRKLLKIKMLP